MSGISIIIPSYNEGAMCGRTAISAARALEDKDVAGEVIVYDDHSDDYTGLSVKRAFERAERADLAARYVRVLRGKKRLGSRAGRDAGAAAARNDMLIFLDAHTELETGFIEKTLYYLHAVDDEGARKRIYQFAIADIQHIDNVFGYGRRFDPDYADFNSIVWMPPRSGADYPYPVMLIGGAACVMSRGLLSDIGGWDGDGLANLWGHEDTALAMRARARGVECAVMPDVVAYTAFRDELPYSGVKSPEHAYNELRLARLYLDEDRFLKVYDSYREAYPELIGAATLLLLKSDVEDARREFRAAARKSDIDAWFAQFRVHW